MDELEDIMLRGRSQSAKATCHRIPVNEMSGRDRPREPRCGLAEGGGESALGDGVPLGGLNVRKLDAGDGALLSGCTTNN